MPAIVSPLAAAPEMTPLKVRALVLLFVHVWDVPRTVLTLIVWAAAPWNTLRPPVPRVSVLPALMVTGRVESEVKLRLRMEKSAPRRMLVRLLGFGGGVK